MICLIALIVFAVLGIFSATHRAWAREAFDCVFRRITLRKCNTGFDQKMRTKISATLMKYSPRLSGFTFKHFEAISWAFTILMIASLLFSALGAYNFLVYGNCNGPHSGDACIFNPTGDISCGSEKCAAEGCDCDSPIGNCTAENNYTACGGECDCDTHVCG